MIGLGTVRSRAHRLHVGCATTLKAAVALFLNSLEVEHASPSTQIGVWTRRTWTQSWIDPLEVGVAFVDIATYLSCDALMQYRCLPCIVICMFLYNPLPPVDLR